MAFIQIFCGSFILLTGLAAFVLNIQVLFVLYQFRFLDSKHNSVYILAFANIVGNTIQLFVSSLYLGPTSIMQKDYFEEGPESFGTKFMSWLFLGAWYCDMFFQPVTALNRLIVVVFPHYGHIFNQRNTTICAVFVLIFGFVLAVISDFVIPCCIAYVYFKVYSYAYLQTGFNYVNTYIDMPVNSSSSFISIFCYIIIFVYVRQNNLKASHFNRELSTIRRTKEIRYAIQFAFCSIFALFAWVTFRVFPLIVPENQLAWFTFIAFCVIAHSAANSLIFVCFNKEFKDKFFQKGLSTQNSQNFSSHFPNVTNAQVLPASHKEKY